MTPDAGTSSRLGCPPRYGTPRTLSRATLGPKVGEVARMLGQPLMPWQQHVVDVALEIDPETGRLAYSEILLLVGRQQGKTTLVLPKLTHRALGMAHLAAQRIVYTAQTADKAREKWRDNYVARLQRSPLAEFIAPGSPRLRLNFEALEFTNGSTFVPVTPSAKTGGTGDSIDEAFIDEAWAHDDSGVEQALSPAMVTRTDPQLWIVSTAKRQPKGAPYNPRFAAYLRSKVAGGRARVEAGVREGTAVFEWSAPDTADPQDPATWWGCLPAMGHTVTEAAMRAQLGRMDLADFCAEFLGWWDSDAQLRWTVIPEMSWRALADRRLRPGYPMGFGVHTSPDRGMTAIVSAGPGPGGLWCVEVVEHRPGTGWVVERMAELAAKWRPCGVAVAASGEAASLIDPLTLAGVGVKPMTVRTMARAYGGFFEAAMDTGVLRHAGQAELDASVALAWKRKVGGQTMWDWASPGDAGPVVAASAALWCAQTFGPAHQEADYDILKSVY